MYKRNKALKGRNTIARGKTPGVHANEKPKPCKGAIMNATTMNYLID